VCQLGADIGSPVRLAGDFLEKNYEQSLDGTDSNVLKIDGIDSFNNLMVKNKGVSVVRCFFQPRSNSDATDKTSLDQPAVFYQDVARDLSDKATFHSVDFAENTDVVEQLTSLLSKVSIGNTALATGNPALYSFLLSLTHQLVHVLTDNMAIPPFFLFFKAGTMVVPGMITYTTQKDLLVALGEQFERLDKIVPKPQPIIMRHVHAPSQAQPSNESFWHKVKGVFKGWFSKK